ncbi:MAG: PSD1 and planctomycete cytochrome C domain-containing protein [Pirellulaceae bacterium]
MPRSFSRRRLFILLLACVWHLPFVAATLVAAEKQPRPSADNDPRHAEKMARGLDLFKVHVRPILVGRCLKCHGGETTEAEFDITTREGLLKGGAEGPVLAVGKAKQSRLYKLITHKEEPAMPEDGARLSDANIAHLVEWIDLGAPYDKSLGVEDADPLAWTRSTIDDSRKQFWSFRPLADVAPPAAADDDWSRTPIDAFVLAKLAERKIAPNAEADRRTLIRRAYFDLIGLPPTARQVEEFLADDDPEAYERVIDRLLESPHYGERWGRHWLDVARFAESHGFEQDYDRPHAYHFRDFVIRALNDDMPFDQFVRWQLAGDEFAPDNPLAMMATGFLGSGVFPTQITANEVERTRYDALDDMTATVGTAMLGLTVGCARCHDHKYDPIPQADYYRMAATFTTTVRSNIELNMHPEAYRQAKAEFDREHAPLVAALEVYQQGELAKRFDAWLTGAKPAERELLEAARWSVLDDVEAKSKGGAKFRRLDDGSLLAEGENPADDVYTLTAQTTLADLRAIRLEALPHASLAKGGPGRAPNGNFALSKIEATIDSMNNDDPPAPIKLTLVRPRASFQQNAGKLAVAAALVDDPQSGWAVDPQFGKRHAAVFALDAQSQKSVANLPSDDPKRLVVSLKFSTNKQHALGRFRLSLTLHEGDVDFDAPEIADQLRVALQRTISQDADKLSDKQRGVLRDYFYKQDSMWKRLHARIDEHVAEAPRPDMQTVMVASEGFKPIRHHTQGADFFPETYFLHRGDCEQKRGVAEPGFLQVLSSAKDGGNRWRETPPEGWRTSYRRRSLANWMTDTESGPGQLLARVIVNRLWQHHFGRGIVETPNDFGAQGASPSHPQLLDWLAGELIRGGWRLKPLHKLMMTSQVYRQTSQHRDAAAAADPENRLLWRYPPRRLEAEVLRDAMLAVSGKLDRTMFGPGTLDEQHQRRSIYFMVKRSKLIPMMQLFDAPEPLVSVGDRPSTTIAPQALLFMNNEQVRSYAKGFASSLLKSAEAREDGSPDWDALVARGYMSALGRRPTKAERADNVAFLEQQAQRYADDKQAESNTLALADFCQVLMSLNEFVYVE